MNAERREEIREDVARELRPVVHYCEIASEPTKHYEPVASPCGRVATWWSDEIQDGATVWMCDAHQREIALRTDAEICGGPDGDE
jgi:hypothetical protein